MYGQTFDALYQPEYDRRRYSRSPMDDQAPLSRPVTWLSPYLAQFWKPVHVWLPGNRNNPIVAYRYRGRLFLSGGREIPESVVLHTAPVQDEVLS